MQLPARPSPPPHPYAQPAPANGPYDQGYPVSQTVPRSDHAPSIPPMPSPAMLPSHATGYPSSHPPDAMPLSSRGYPSVAPSAAGAMGLPRADGPPVAAAQHRAAGTGLWSGLAYGVLALLTLVTLGATLALLGLAAVSEWFLRRRIRMQIVGSCLRVSAEQLPELYHSAAVMAQRLGLAQLPEIYILETSSMSAIAARLGGRNMVIVTDDAVDACMRSGDIRTLNFIVARELAHHALGHTGLIRNAMKMALPPLSRLDELSADAVATAIVGQPEVAANALITMLTGPQLLPFVNRHALMQQAFEVATAKAAKKAEQPMRQPLLMRRIARIYQPGL